jgi:DNA-binding transcriptional ArsR family regulator
MRRRNQREQALAFAVSQGRKPFTYRGVMAALGCGKARACAAMAALREQGAIELISSPREGIYRLTPLKVVDVSEYDWRPKSEILTRIVGKMRQGKPYTTGELSELTGLPKTTTRRYLKVLVYQRRVAAEPIPGAFIYYRTSLDAEIIGESPTWGMVKDVLKKLKAAWAAAEVDDAETGI